MKSSLFLPHIMYGLLTKCEVKMAEYWPSSFFCVFMDRVEVEVHKLAKKRTRPISSHFDLTNLVKKGFIIWLLVKFCSRDTAGSQSQRAIWFILPADGASHIIICDIVLKLEVGRFYKAFSHIIKHFPCMGTMAT